MHAEVTGSPINELMMHDLGPTLLNYSHSRIPPVRAHTDARTNPSAHRATQLRSVLARVYAVSIQNQITNNVP
jgi:hypothetical protein